VNGRLAFTVVAALAMIAYASAVFPQTSGQAATKDSAAVAQLEQRWLAAVSLGGDRSALDAILADDYIDTDWQGRTRNKTDLLRGAAAKGASEHVAGLRVRVWGDTAVATGTNHIHSSAKGWSADVTFTDIFSRIDGRWRAVASQETLRKPAPPAH